MVIATHFSLLLKVARGIPHGKGAIGLGLEGGLGGGLGTGLGGPIGTGLGLHGGIAPATYKTSLDTAFLNGPAIAPATYKFPLKGGLH